MIGMLKWVQDMGNSRYDKFYGFFGKRKEQTPEYRMDDINPPKSFYGTRKDWEDIQLAKSQTIENRLRILALGQRPEHPVAPADREEGVYVSTDVPNDPVLNPTASTFNYPTHLQAGDVYVNGNGISIKSQGHKYEHEPLIYTKTDLDKIVMMLTLWIDDIPTRDKLEEIYQCWKDTQKV